LDKTSLIPNRALFRYEFPLRYREDVEISGDVAHWTDACLLPYLGGLEGQAPFARIWMAWNERGLFLACEVKGRRGPLQCNPRQFWKGDNLRLCTDMRDTRDIKRASRYCQQFYMLPAGGGAGGRQPVIGSAKIHRATEHAPPPPADLLAIASSASGQGYTIEAYIAAEALAGFDPEEHRRIGVFTMVEDSELGQQYLTVGDDLYWYIDPSTWATGVLTRD
jgi:hypothetical protein